MNRSFRRPADGRESLERVLRWPSCRTKLGDQVRIYSSEHHSYWRPDARGYTRVIAEAGVYPTRIAINLTSHCDHAKRIRFEPVGEAVTAPPDGKTRTRTESHDNNV